MVDFAWLWDAMVAPGSFLASGFDGHFLYSVASEGAAVAWDISELKKTGAQVPSLNISYIYLWYVTAVIFSE